jgi:hypothetical protein
MGLSPEGIVPSQRKDRSISGFGLILKEVTRSLDGAIPENLNEFLFNKLPASEEN